MSQACGSETVRGVARITRLPILILHAHSRCNCRCAMCDIWKEDQSRWLTRATVSRLLPDMHSLGVEWVVFTGGEPLMNPELFDCARLLKCSHIRATLLTSGLLLERFAEDVASCFDEVIISIDGPAGIHDQIRGVRGASSAIERGVAKLRGIRASLPIRARTTVQSANRQALCATVEYVRSMGLNTISFLAADLTSHAFHRELVWPIERQMQVGFSENALPELEAEMRQLLEHHSEDIASGFIVESAAKLRRIVSHFRAHLGLQPEVAPRCNAPWVSAVVETDGSVRPCFFHRQTSTIANQNLIEALNSGETVRFREELDVRNNDTCKRCVCSLNYRT